MSNAPDQAPVNRPEAGAETEPLPPLVLPADVPTLAPTGPTTPTEETTCPLIPGYQILSELGRGGMGVVYKARQEGLERLVALKMILAGSHAGPEHLARFRAEAKAIGNLRHPHIVQVYQVGQHEGKPFLALEFADGGSLAQALDGRPWPAERAAAFVAKLAGAMHAVHGKGIIHRDLKPGNVLLDEQGEPKITDFGLAKVVEGPATGPTATNAALGTPSYMAPEQTGGRNREVGPLTDVYALGAILYELLTGRPPFRADTPLDTMLLVVSEEPTPPRKLCPAVPLDLEKVCLKCLAKRPDERYASAAALADDLRRFCAGEPVSARPPGLLRRFGKWQEKHPGTTVALGIAACLWLVWFAPMVLFRNVLTAPLFALVLLLFVRPTRKTFLVSAATLLVLGLVQWVILLRGSGLWGVTLGLAILVAQGLVPALVIGTAGRVVAWVMKRDAVATTLGAYFGSLLGAVCACGGGLLIFFVALGQENFQKFQDVNQKYAAKAKEIQTKQPRAADEEYQEEMLALWRGIDITWPVVFTGTWVVLSALLPTLLGAFLGAAATGRKKGPAVARALG
jgi:predicted Ser/Thr protein kinase